MLFRSACLQNTNASLVPARFGGFLPAVAFTVSEVDAECHSVFAASQLARRDHVTLWPLTPLWLLGKPVGAIVLLCEYVCSSHEGGVCLRRSPSVAVFGRSLFSRRERERETETERERETESERGRERERESRGSSGRVGFAQVCRLNIQRC